jgi:UDP-3-O-[3-hydroxymyristoyl] glucosamine N-acyltransferase
MLDLSASVSDDVYIGEFAYIGPNAKIGAGAKIFPQVHIGEGVVIGENSVIYPGVIVYRDCRIGKQCIIHAGTVIGSDGFGFAPRPDGGYMKIPQLGNVIIEDEVEVGASCTIDRATLGATVIRKGVKLDNLIHVAHNVEIGEHTVIAAQTGISGSTKIGKHCQIGGQVGLVGHITIADGSRINAQSGVSKSLLETNKAITGTPAFDYTAALRSQAVYKMLPELLKRVEELEQRLKESELDTHVGTLAK